MRWTGHEIVYESRVGSMPSVDIPVYLVDTLVQVTLVLHESVQQYLVESPLETGVSLQFVQVGQLDDQVVPLGCDLDLGLTDHLDGETTVDLDGRVV